MNYYHRHIGDYLRDCSHLSLLEHGVYSRLLDLYYVREQGIPADSAARMVGARTPEEIAAVDAVLRDFFVLTDGVWVQARCEREIVEARSRIEAAKTNGQKGGRPKKNPPETQQKPSGFPLGTPEVTQPKAHQSPITNHSVPNGTGGSSPPLADPVKAMFDEGVRLLTDSGVGPGQARSLIGKWRATSGDVEVMAALTRCRDLRITEPIPWLTRALQPRAAARRPSTLDLVPNPDYETPL